MLEINVFQAGSFLGKLEFDKPEIKIGRANGSDVHLTHQAVSRVHARITKQNTSYVIEDLNSKFGTFIKGLKIQKKVISNGDTVLIGNYSLRFNIGTRNLNKNKPAVLPLKKEPMIDLIPPQETIIAPIPQEKTEKITMGNAFTGYFKNILSNGLKTKSYLYLLVIFFLVSSYLFFDLAYCRKNKQIVLYQKQCERSISEINNGIQEMETEKSDLIEKDKLVLSSIAKKNILLEVRTKDLDEVRLEHDKIKAETDIYVKKGDKYE